MQIDDAAIATLLHKPMAILGILEVCSMKNKFQMALFVFIIIIQQSISASPVWA